jgi:DNA-binding response OmpR family regulator
MPSAEAATVLVLERNAALQELLEQALRGAGHHVLCTPDPDEALEVARRIKVDVLVLGEPAPNGPSSINEIRALQPGVEVLDIAHADEGLAELMSATRLPKPLSLDDLRSAVASLVERTPLVRRAGG